MVSSLNLVFTRTSLVKFNGLYLFRVGSKPTCMIHFELTGAILILGTFEFSLSDCHLVFAGIYLGRFVHVLLGVSLGNFVRLTRSLG